MSSNYDKKDQFFIANGTIKNIVDLNDQLIDKHPSIYEVIRVLSGIPLFVEEHIERLENSLRLIGSSYELPNESLLNNIKKLIEINGFPANNIKIIINQLNSSSPDTYVFFIPSSYPELKQYEQGVPAILYTTERHNPNAKVVAKGQREVINKALRDSCTYEALLVNSKNDITEGSRSNVFFIKGDIVYTPPANQVLEGITRKRVMNLCQSLGIKVVEEIISKDALHEVDAIFMTGTSPKVLPISSVDKILYESSNNKIVHRIMKAYDKIIDEYLQKNRT